MAKRKPNLVKVDTESGPWLVRFMRGHIRLWSAIMIGIVVYALTPASFIWVTRFLFAWDIGVASYLIIVLATLAHASPSEIRYHSAMQDEGASALQLLAVAAVLVSLGAIFAELVGVERTTPNFELHIALALFTVVLSWIFLHTIFALHYAHEYYGSGQRAGGLRFPSDQPPDYWDFVYFAYVIGMTFQVSDVGITHREIRRTVLAHGMLSFLFTVSIVALAVNIASSLVGK